MFEQLMTLNWILAVGGLVLALCTVGLYIDYYTAHSTYYRRFVAPFVWPLVVATTVGSVILSLVYSEYFGFVPCSLCWLQRIALYPQALLALMAVRTKEHTFFPRYSIALSLFGAVIALYHYAEQMLPKEAAGSILPCLADGSADCAAKIIDEFGFVTFPLLSFVTFAFLIVLYLNLRRTRS